jgi:sigma-B regulation protein RsbU (phosphoserine phosphatase)
LLKKSGEVRTLTKGGVILGVISTLVPYEVESTPLESGDILLLFTDGVTEAMNTAREEFGEARLIALLKAHADKSASKIIEHIVEQTSHFQPAGEQHDDITLVCIKLTN